MDGGKHSPYKYRPTLPSQVPSKLASVSSQHGVLQQHGFF